MKLFRAAPRALLPLVFFLFFFGLPLFVVILTAFTGKVLPLLDRILSLEWGALYREIASSASLSAFEELAAVKRYQRALTNSLWLAAVTATLSTLLAIPISLALARRALFGRRFFETLVLLPLATPAFLYAFSIILLFRDNGILSAWIGPVFEPFSVAGLIFTQVTAFLPLAVLAQAPSFALYQSGWTLVGRSLGAPPFLSAFQVWLPLNFYAILTGWILVALRSLGDFVSPMLLTSTRFRVLVLEIWRDLAGSNWWPTAAALSLELLLIAALLLFAEKFLLRRSADHSGLAPSFFTPLPSAWKKFLASGFCLLILAVPMLCCASILAFAFGAFDDSGWTLSHFRQALHEAPPFALNSLLLGLSATAAALAASVLIVRQRRWRWAKSAVMALAVFAFAIPSTLYAIGLVGAFNLPPVALHFTPALLIIAVLVTRMNYSLKILEDAQRKIGFDAERAAAVLGGSSLFRFRWAVFPFLKSALASGGVLVFISSLQDVAISIFIAPPSFYPLSLEIARNIADGLFSQAAAFGSILMALLLFLSVLAFRGLSGGRTTEI